MPTAETAERVDTPERPGPLVQWIQLLGDAISRACLWCAGFSLLIIVGICGINVARRHFFGSAWSWAEEAMLFLMVVVVFLGAATVTWSGVHLKLDMLLRALSPRLRQVAVYSCAVIAVTVLALCTVVSFQVVKLLYDYNQKSQALELVLWIPQGLVCVGFALMGLLTVMRLIVVGASLPADHLS